MSFQRKLELLVNLALVLGVVSVVTVAVKLLQLVGETTSQLGWLKAIAIAIFSVGLTWVTNNWKQVKAMLKSDPVVDHDTDPDPALAPATPAH